MAVLMVNGQVDQRLKAPKRGNSYVGYQIIVGGRDQLAPLPYNLQPPEAPASRRGVHPASTPVTHFWLQSLAAAPHR